MKRPLFTLYLFAIGISACAQDLIKSPEEVQKALEPKHHYSIGGAYGLALLEDMAKAGNARVMFIYASPSNIQICPQVDYRMLGKDHSVTGGVAINFPFSVEESYFYSGIFLGFMFGDRYLNAGVHFGYNIAVGHTINIYAEPGIHILRELHFNKSPTQFYFPIMVGMRFNLD